METLDTFLQALGSGWDPRYLLWIIASIVLSALLLRHNRHIVVFTSLMLAVFFILLIGTALALTVDSANAAAFMRQTAILILGMLLIRLTGLLIFRRVVPRLHLKSPRILEELLILLAYVIWLLVRLSYAGLDLSSLVASTAVLTAVVAFAMQDTLGNILSGLALQLDHSVTIGDWIVLEDETHGEVIEVQWRHTALRTLFNEIIVIPNSQLMRGQVKIIGGRSIPKRRASVFFYGAFDADPSVVIDTIQASLSRVQIEGVDQSEQVVVQATDFKDGVITYAIRYWLNDPRRVGMSASMLRCHVYTVFERHGWHLGAPTMDLGIVSQQRKYDPKRYGIDFELRMERLRRVPLLSPLTDDELEALARRLTRLNFIAGSVLVRQGEAGTSLFIIVQGEADVWLAQGPHQQLVAQVGSNDVVGEMSLLTGEPRSATVITRSHMLCYEMHKEDFEQILQKRPELAQTLADLLEARDEELASARAAVPGKAETGPPKRLILENIRNWFGLSTR